MKGDNMCIVGGRVPLSSLSLSLSLASGIRTVSSFFVAIAIQSSNKLNMSNGSGNSRNHAWKRTRHIQEGRCNTRPSRKPKRGKDEVNSGVRVQHDLPTFLNVDKTIMTHIHTHTHEPLHTHMHTHALCMW